mmetsp:Transcript_5493/g.13874  ORF Transcript_5493/g.13874 Transcript_5493/m.13874 type:complete len:453 (-) Transcript_5493:201-1559(-)
MPARSSEVTRIRSPTMSRPHSTATGKGGTGTEGVVLEDRVVVVEEEEEEEEKEDADDEIEDETKVVGFGDGAAALADHEPMEIAYADEAASIEPTFLLDADEAMPTAEQEKAEKAEPPETVEIAQPSEGSEEGKEAAVTEIADELYFDHTEIEFVEVTPGSGSPSSAAKSGAASATSSPGDAAEARLAVCTPSILNHHGWALRAIPIRVKTGDLFLFSSRVASVSVLTKILTRSQWTHVGMVVRRPDGLKLLEALRPVGGHPGGVCLCNLESRLRGEMRRDSFVGFRRLQAGSLYLDATEKLHAYLNEIYGVISRYPGKRKLIASKLKAGSNELDETAMCSQLAWVCLQKMGLLSKEKYSSRMHPKHFLRDLDQYLRIDVEYAPLYSFNQTLNRTDAKQPDGSGAIPNRRTILRRALLHPVGKLNFRRRRARGINNDTVAGDSQLASLTALT